jgi:hypothetical protein
MRNESSTNQISGFEHSFRENAMNRGFLCKNRDLTAQKRRGARGLPTMQALIVRVESHARS